MLSVILLVLSWILIRQPRGKSERQSQIHTSLDSVGLLQFTWLLANTPHSTILERISKVDVPSTYNLRKAGMFEVLMSEAIEIGDAECSPLREPAWTDEVDITKTTA